MKKTVLALIVVLVIALAALVLLAVTRHSPAQTYEQQCKGLRDQDRQLIIALKTKSCGALSDARDSALCGAWTTFNPAACPADVASCPAIASGAPDKCPEGDAWCVAFASDDAAKCAASATEDEQKECVAWINRDESFFENTQDCSNVPQGI